MKKLLLQLIPQTAMKKVKAFLTENGFVSVLALIITGVAMFMGKWILAGGAAGFFIGRNWEIIKKLWKESKLKDKVDDVVDDVKDKF